MNKPTVLLLVAWLWIIIGVLTIAVWGGVAFTVMNAYNSVETIKTTMDINNSSENTDEFALMEKMIRKIYFISLGIVLVGVFSVIAGIYLLKFCAWARLSLEVFSWLGLIYIIFNSIKVVKNFTLFKSALLMMQKTTTFGLFPVIIALIFIITYTIVFIVSIKLLRGKTIREVIVKYHTTNGKSPTESPMGNPG